MFAPTFFMYFESESNTEFQSYENAFLYSYNVIMGSDITDLTISTTNGKILTGGLSLLNLVFFGFIASIITITIQLKIQKAKSGRKPY